MFRARRRPRLQREQRGFQRAAFVGQGAVDVATIGGPATVLALTGKPINDPIARHGPFAMNSAAEIHAVYADFQSGEFGRVAA